MKFGFHVTLPQALLCLLFSLFILQKRNLQSYSSSEKLFIVLSHSQAWKVYIRICLVTKVIGWFEALM